MSKCNYCSFYSVQYIKGLSKKYLISLEKEFKEYSQKYDFNNIETIYIGGGNPAISLKDLNQISKILSSLINMSKIKEFTIECNPVNLSINLIELFKKIGCNRVSVGIQSFNKKITFYCNRKKQNLIIINNSLKLLNKNNFNISIDLINGLPNTDINKELFNLNLILKKYKNINHISFYDLLIEKGSKFYNLKNIQYLNEKERIKYENEFNKLIKNYRFKRYEVSNYTKNNNYSLHNFNYWKYKNYIGLGPAAHSKINELKIENVPDLNRYIELKDYKITYNLTKKEQIEEYILMGFRLVQGINIKDFYSRFNIEIIFLLNKTIEKYMKLKMVNIKNNYIKINKRGLNILNQILVEFFNELDLKEKEKLI